MNMNKKFLAEAVELEKRWLAKGLVHPNMMSARLTNELDWPFIGMKCKCGTPLVDMYYEYHCPKCFGLNYDPNAGRYRKSDPMSYNVQCLICEKALVYDNEWVYDGGVIHLSFGYGSKHDQMGMRSQMPENHLDKLLCSNQIEGYVCDECFEKKQSLLRGFHVKRKEIREEITNKKEESDEPT